VEEFPVEGREIEPLLEEIFLYSSISPDELANYQIKVTSARN